MELGTFSISLAVRDLAASRAFYEKLGFEVSGGNPEHNYLILRNGHHVIGLFQGMFDKNILTFNPGWNHECEEVNPFTDVREIQRALIDQGVELNETVDEATTGPGHITLIDPDGNPILIDQHR
jgi:catechol 2,3-dioxygenase-like lactoylglutathione lyase family enzyme